MEGKEEGEGEESVEKGDRRGESVEERVVSTRRENGVGDAWYEEKGSGGSGGYGEREWRRRWRVQGERVRGGSVRRVIYVYIYTY